VIDRSADALRHIADQFHGRVRTVASSRGVVSEPAKQAGLLIGAMLIPGAAAPRLVTHDTVRGMISWSAIVDIAIDQSGCVETARATNHSEPTYVVDDVIHYCVANMPGAVPRTSTFALNSVTLPFTLALANKGRKKALEEDPYPRCGLNVHARKLACAPVPDAHGLRATSPEDVLAA
jgi:alanine dehydrogenase